MEPLKTELGMNLTGVMMSPIDTEKMLAGTNQEAPVMPGETTLLAALRTAYIAESDSLGSVPLPGSVKGVVKTSMDKLLGKRPEVFIDKLGERLAFERGGTRLYDALLTKCRAMADGAGAPIDLDRLAHFRDEEAEHFELIATCMEELGADPTSQTPCADVVGVENMGLMQVVSDPRTTISQGLNAILTAELVDNAGWELLIQLAEDLGKSDMVTRFEQEQALAAEVEHLEQVREWVAQCVKQEAGRP